MATGQISRCRRLVAADLAGENTEVLRASEGEEASAAAEEEVFGLERSGFFSTVFPFSFSNDDFVKTTVVEWERIGISKDVYWSLLSLSLNLSNTLISGKNSDHRRRIHGHRTNLSAPSSRFIRSLGPVVSLQQILPEKTHKCFGRVKEKKPPPPRKRKCLVWRSVREISCSTLFRIFHRFLSCAASVDVVDEKDY
ncbi:uncharacterized protein G2W53_017951 [Senna tora]|uniref:Uncharacterized protein n=1 Tax=Senna tora TaxID=362788 RepID=A0A834TRU0_9FABA|nr:uncharacterized protein G2W53_017951 [Senna tora]